MRVNIYSEEMTGKVELVTKTVEGEEFTAVRFWLYLPVTVMNQGDAEDLSTRQVQGPFLHRPGDDDSSAVTFWGKRELRGTLAEALRLLDEHYEPNKIPDAMLAKLEGEKLTSDAHLEQRLQGEIAALRATLADPHAVHANILREGIALTRDQAIHIAGLPADVDKQLAEVATLRATVERLNQEMAEAIDGNYVLNFLKH